MTIQTPLKYKINDKKQWKLFQVRKNLIKEKQILYSWLEFYKRNESLDTYKPESDRYLQSTKCRAQINNLDNQLNEIESFLNLN